jgi:hypothetical protein
MTLKETKLTQAPEYKGRKLYFVYVIRDPRNGEIFYVGYSSRPKCRWVSSPYNFDAEVRMREIRAAGFCPQWQSFGVFGTQLEARYQEAWAIQEFIQAGAPLTNRQHPRPEHIVDYDTVAIPEGRQPRADKGKPRGPYKPRAKPTIRRKRINGVLQNPTRVDFC